MEASVSGKVKRNEHVFEEASRHYKRDLWDFAFVAWRLQACLPAPHHEPMEGIRIHTPPESPRSQFLAEEELTYGSVTRDMRELKLLLMCLSSLFFVAKASAKSQRTCTGSSL